MTAAVPRAIDIAREATRAGVFATVFGGIHPTVCTTEMAQYGTAIVREIEGGIWKQVLYDYIHNTKLSETYCSPLISDLRDIPLTSKEIYAYARRWELQQISNSRGCPLNCDYCTATIVSGNRTRYRPPEQVIAELKYRGLLEGEKGLTTFFTADNFGLPKDIEVLRQLEEVLQGKEFHSFVQVGINALFNNELLQLANRIGNTTLGIGIESPFREGLATIKNGIVGRDPIVAFENVKKYPNIRTILLMMVGFDFEPNTVFEDMNKYIMKLQPDGVYLSILTPLPGSKTAIDLKDRITDRNWGHYDTRHLVHQPYYKAGEENYRSWNPESFMQGYYWLQEQIKTYLNKSRLAHPVY
jgi:radical SAM superfamily enzyme YgiQ (UPF0313 family)